VRKRNTVTAQRANGLDTLRAAAIALVFMYHYWIFVSHEQTFGWASAIGWTGVDLFFVLSGYLIANQIFKGIARGQQLSAGAFYARRLLRTIPNFYAVLALYLLLPAWMGGSTPPPAWRFLTFTQNIGLHSGTAFSHAWSLCIEEQFYLLFPLVTLIGARYVRSIRAGWILVGGLALAAIALRSVLWLKYGTEAGDDVKGYYPNLYYATLCRADEFLPGIAIAMLKNFHRDRWQRLMQHGQALLLVATIATASILCGAYRWYYIDNYGYGYFMTGFGYSLIACAYGLMVLAALSPSSWLARTRIPGASALALWSYAIYLTHKSIGIIANHELDGAVSPAALVAIVIVASLIGGWLLYRLVETPFMRLRDRRVPTSFPAARASGSLNVAISAADEGG
jgi:peptidoglycan/LPS O-acetylase OafA/YrhL